MKNNTIIQLAKLLKGVCKKEEKDGIFYLMGPKNNPIFKSTKERVVDYYLSIYNWHLLLGVETVQRYVEEDYDKESFLLWREAANLRLKLLKSGKPLPKNLIDLTYLLERRF